MNHEKKLELITIPSEVGIYDISQKPTISHITFKDSLKKSWSRGVPVLISRSARAFANYWGMRLLGQISKEINAAQTPINAINQLIIGLVITPLIKVNTDIGNHYKEEERTGEIANTTCAALLYSTLVGGITNIAMGSISGFLNVIISSEESRAIALDFFSTARYSMIPLAYLMTASQALTALDDTIPLVVVNMLGVGFAIFLQYEWVKIDQAKGLGRSMAVEEACSSALLMIYLGFKLNKNRKFRTALSFKKIMKEFFQFIKSGFIYDIISCTELFSTIILASLVTNYLSTDDSEIYNMITQFLALAYPMHQAVRQTTTAIVANLIGEKKNVLRYSNGFTEAHPIDKIAPNGSVADKDESKDLPVIMEQGTNNSIYAGVANSLIISSGQAIFFLAGTSLISSGYESANHNNFDSRLRQLFLIALLSQICDGISETYTAAFYANRSLKVPLLSVFIFILIVNSILAIIGVNADLGLPGLAGMTSISMLLQAVFVVTGWRKYEMPKIISTTATVAGVVETPNNKFNNDPKTHLLQSPSNLNSSSIWKKNRSSSAADLEIEEDSTPRQDNVWTKCLKLCGL